jgi:hypothetical protein
MHSRSNRASMSASYKTRHELAEAVVDVRADGCGSCSSHSTGRVAPGVSPWGWICVSGPCTALGLAGTPAAGCEDDRHGDPHRDSHPHTATAKARPAA